MMSRAMCAPWLYHLKKGDVKLPLKACRRSPPCIMHYLIVPGASFGNLLCQGVAMTRVMRGSQGGYGGS